MNPSHFAYRKSTVVAWTLIAVLSIFVALLTQFAPPTHASGDRGFVGFYRVSDATVLGDQVRLTFSARIFNYTGSEITSATATLRGPGAPKGIYATFYGITLADQKGVRLSQDITIPLREYERWGKGLTPLLSIDYLDLSGSSQRRPLQLTRGPVGEE